MKKMLYIISFFLLYNAAVLAGDNKIVENNSSLSGETIIATVAGRDITYNDFISRAEYTFRPVYCRGTSGNEKNIILNSLIAEKLFAIQAEQTPGIVVNKDFLDMIEGRKEQKMRELLYREEGLKKVKLDNNEVKKYFELSGRTYKVQYLNINDKNAAAETAAKLRDSKDSLAGSIVFEGLSSDTKNDSLPEREVTWNSPEHEFIMNALFNGNVKKGDVIGPLSINDSVNLVLIVKGWNDEVAVTSNEIQLRWSNVEEKLTTVKADSIYDRYVLSVIGNKTINFFPGTFNKLAEMFAPFYTNRKSRENSENDFFNLVYMNEVEIPDPEVFEATYESLRGKKLLEINGEDWTVDDLKNQIDKHPLVFRRNSYTNNFAEQLKLAIVDLIRDKYLTWEAYRRGLDKSYNVAHYTQIWKDAGMALIERENYLVKTGFTGEFKLKDFDEYLNPYLKSLVKKYTDQIKINVEAYNNIRLTRTDMYTTQPDVPYKIYVPAFPQLTTYNRLDYGIKMKTNN